MIEFFSFTVNWLAICIVFAIPGVLFERWLVGKGFVPDRTKPLVLSVISLVLIKQIWFREISWFFYALVIILAMTCGVHRWDFWTLANRGKWWWKSKE